DARADRNPTCPASGCRGTAGLVTAPRSSRAPYRRSPLRRQSRSPDARRAGAAAPLSRAARRRRSPRAWQSHRGDDAAAIRRVEREAGAVAVQEVEPLADVGQAERLRARLAERAGVRDLETQRRSVAGRADVDGAAAGIRRDTVLHGVLDEGGENH